MLINRDYFLQKLLKWTDKTDFIKIITGVRRCGKSTLFTLYQDILKQKGITADRIININFEKAIYADLLDWKKLNNYILKNISKKKINYVFLDEIQMVPDFQKAVSSLRLEKNIDLYLTGSNAYMYSQKISTLLSGRYIEIKMFPLSFKEYVSAFKNENISNQVLFENYCLFGSFPDITKFIKTKNNSTVISEEEIEMYLDSLYNTIVAKDISLRTGIDSIEEITRIVKFLFGNIGSETSFNNIMNTVNNEFKFSSNGKNLYVSKIQKIVEALKESFLFYQCDKQQLRGKELLRTTSKYYAADTGLRKNILGGNKTADMGHILENIVYMELLRRGYRVYTGKYYNNEIDFVVEQFDNTKYFQVALSVDDETTFAREIKPLEKIKDNFEKSILVLNNPIQKSYKGIKIINIIDWLLE